MVRSTARWLAVAAVVSLAGCRCEHQTLDAGGGTDANGPGTDAVGPGTDAAGPGTDAAGPGTDAAGPGTDAAAGTSDLSAAIGTVNLFGDCMPIVPADPWVLMFDVTYDNTTGTAPATATITSATLTFSGGTMPVLDLTATPATSGAVAAGGTAMVTHTKTASTPDIPMDCTHCGESATLDVTWDVAGSAIMATSGPVTVSCAF